MDASTLHTSGSSTGTVFGNELLDLGIRLINSRPYHHRINGRLEQFHRALETETGRHNSMDDFIAYYNDMRLYWSLDIDNR